MKEEEALVRIFFQAAPASARKWEQAEALIAEAPEEARWRLRRLLGACEIVRAALRGEAPPTRWEVIPVRSRKRREARVERARARPAAGQETRGEAPPSLPAAPASVELAAPVSEPASASDPMPTARPALACPRCRVSP